MSPRARVRLRIGLRGCHGPAGKGDWADRVRDRNCLDRRENAPGHRDDADRSGRVERLHTVVEDDAEAGVRLGATPWGGCRALD
jgi:hypothetical protein